VSASQRFRVSASRGEIVLSGASELEKVSDGESPSFCALNRLSYEQRINCLTARSGLLSGNDAKI
jgi:hypothetical protein